ncbi:hypothetical protein J4Q44_G00152120 [Coregonus suidteri]|uniref:Uncharacterized protein n=1 Tax=Coregonus suidteri TaxID=861788 RepID=A0AAN8LJC1_9TELE
MTPLKEDNPGGLVNEDDKDYILDHAEHLNRMVPGGLSVMGMFVVSPSHQTKESHMKMRRLRLWLLWKTVYPRTGFGVSQRRTPMTECCFISAPTPKK